jgi:hypothetical protein
MPGRTDRGQGHHEMAKSRASGHTDRGQGRSVVVQEAPPVGAQGSSSSQTLSLAGARKKSPAAPAPVDDILLLMQAVVQPLQVTRLTSHWTAKRTLSETRGQEGDDGLPCSVSKTSHLQKTPQA